MTFRAQAEVLDVRVQAHVRVVRRKQGCNRILHEGFVEVELEDE